MSFLTDLISSLSYIKRIFRSLNYSLRLTSVILSSCLAIWRSSQISIAFQPALTSPSFQCAKLLETAQFFYLYYEDRLSAGYISLRSLVVTLWAEKGVRMQFMLLFAAVLGLFSWP
jgi:hypothetical protein